MRHSSATTKSAGSAGGRGEHAVSLVVISRLQESRARAAGAGRALRRGAPAAARQDRRARDPFRRHRTRPGRPRRARRRLTDRPDAASRAISRIGPSSPRPCAIGSPSQSGGVSHTNARIAMTHMSYGSVVRSSVQKNARLNAPRTPVAWSASAGCSAPGTCSRSGSPPPAPTARRMTHSTPAMRFVNAPIMNSTMRSGRSMKPTLHFVDERLGAGARVARHDREDQRQRGDQHVVAAAELRVEVDQPDEQREIREAIERRIPEGAELRLQLQLVRDLAVDEVEDVGDRSSRRRPATKRRATSAHAAPTLMMTPTSVRTFG